MPAQRYDDSPKSTSALTLRPSRRRSTSRPQASSPPSPTHRPDLNSTSLAPSPPPPYLPISNSQSKLHTSPKFTATQSPPLPHPAIAPTTTRPPLLTLPNLPAFLYPTPKPTDPTLPRYPPQSLHYHRTSPTSIPTQSHLQTSLRTSPTTSL